MIRVDFFDGTFNLPDIGGHILRDKITDIVWQVQPQVDRFVFDDGHTCFIVWRLNIGKQTPFKSCFQAFFQLLHIRRATVRGQDNLLVIFIEVIKGMEKFLLRGFFSCDKLDIIHQEKVCIAVFVAKFEVLPPCSALIISLVN